MVLAILGQLSCGRLSLFPLGVDTLEEGIMYNQTIGGLVVSGWLRKCEKL